jgi:hypothetical protein
MAGRDMEGNGSTENELEPVWYGCETWSIDLGED